MGAREQTQERGEQSAVRHCDYCAVWMAGSNCGEHLNAAIATLDSALAVRDLIVEPDAFVLRTNLGITSIHFGGRQPLQHPHVTLAEAAIDVRELAASASDASGGLDGAAEITRVELIEWDGGKSTRESLRLGESSFG
jgi:hypothetical protein